MGVSDHSVVHFNLYKLHVDKVSIKLGRKSGNFVAYFINWQA